MGGRQKANGKWPNEKKRMYPDWYEYKMYTEFKDYHEKNWGSDFKRDDFIPLFKAYKYQPGKLVELAAEAGMKYIIPFAKHCTGFCLWPSSFTQRDAGDIVCKGGNLLLITNLDGQGALPEMQ